jgi:hypothetical protein
MLETRQRSVARAYLRGLNFECLREAGIEDFDLSLSDLDAPKLPIQDCAQKTLKFLPTIFEFWPAKLTIRPTARHDGRHGWPAPLRGHRPTIAFRFVSFFLQLPCLAILRHAK